MRVPATPGCASTATPGLRAEELGELLALHSIEVERISHVGAALAPRASWSAGCSSAEQHPDADRLTRLRGRHRRRHADDRLRGPQRRRRPDGRRSRCPGAVMPDGTEARQGEAARRRLRRDDPLRGRAARSARTPRGSWSSAGRTRDAGDARSTEVLPVAEPVLELEVELEPGRLPRRLRGRARGARDHRRRARRAALGRGRRGDGRGQGRPTTPRSTVEVPELCPRFTARVFTDVDDRALAAVAEGAADRGRPAADQQRRRHHQLRDAADRAAAARLRPRQGPGRRADHPHRARGREDDHARRRRAQLRRRDGPGLRPRRALRDRRDHGRPGLRGLRRDHAGSCSRWRPGTASTSCAPRASSACARRPRTGSRSSFIPSSRCAPSGSRRGCWSSSAARGWSRARSTSPPRSRAAHVISLRGERGRGAARDARSTPERAREYLERLELRGRAARGRRPRRPRSRPPPLRRHPRGRPDRGGRPDPRLRRAPAARRCRGARPGAAA